MKLLVIDTATSACSAAVWSGDAVAASRFEPMATGHAEALIPMVSTVLAQAGLAVRDLDAIAVTVGPGSFTGLRVGLAAARGYALAEDLPVIGLTTLEVVAHGARALLQPDDAALVAAVETKRRDVYIQLFSSALAPLSPAMAADPAEVAAQAPPGRLAVAGDAADRTAAALAGAGREVRCLAAPVAADAADAVRLAAARIARAGLPKRGEAPAPLYIHPPRATLPAHGGRLRP